MQQSSQTEPSVGFLTVEHSESIGWTGGYLILNSGGRPLEFHCTLPVRPTRTHEILYGNTLRNYLICDLVVPALLKQARVQPMVLCTDLPELATPGQEFNGPPVAIIADRSFGIPASSAGEMLQSQQGTNFWVVHENVDQVAGAFERMTDLADWNEPLERIREAIREAQNGATARAA